MTAQLEENKNSGDEDDDEPEESSNILTNWPRKKHQPVVKRAQSSAVHTNYRSMATRSRFQSPQ